MSPPCFLISLLNTVMSLHGAGLVSGPYILARVVDRRDGAQQSMEGYLHYAHSWECKEGLDFRSWSVPCISQPFRSSGLILLKPLRASRSPGKPKLQASFVLTELSILTDPGGFYELLQNCPQGNKARKLALLVKQRHRNLHWFLLLHFLWGTLWFYWGLVCSW